MINESQFEKNWTQQKEYIGRTANSGNGAKTNKKSDFQG